MKSDTSLRRANLLSLLLLLVGSAAMIGHLTGNQALKGFGLATAASPLPRVFSNAIHQESGLEFETFSAEVELIYQDKNGETIRIAPTRDLARKLAGPYNRRNAYGAVVCYGPALPGAMQQSALRYALITPGTMRDALGLPPEARRFQLNLHVRTARGKETLTATIQ